MAKVNMGPRQTSTVIRIKNISVTPNACCNGDGYQIKKTIKRLMQAIEIDSVKWIIKAVKRVFMLTRN